MENEFELFEGKSLSDVFKDIYNNQQNKKKKIEELVDDFAKHVKNTRDLSEVGSVITSLVDTSVRNDEQLIKMATIAQRIMVTSMKASSMDGSILTEEEKRQLTQAMNEVDDVINSVTK